MSRRVGLLLSGCGFLDGSEIHESVLAMLHLDRHGAEIVCMAPRGVALQVVDHVRREPVSGGQRDVLTEAARIARGKIRDIAAVKAKDLDALVLPGGFGAAKNLSTFAAQGAKATVHAEVARLLREMHGAQKPIGAICIAPAVVAAVLGAQAHPTLTIGEDAGTAQALSAMGCKHQTCAVSECVVDRANRIVTTPAYMYDARIAEVGQGIGRLVDEVMAMLGRSAVAASI
jgi:enhancing lycopene biosynthesis protein 2